MMCDLGFFFSVLPGQTEAECGAKVWSVLHNRNMSHYSGFLFQGLWFYHYLFRQILYGSDSERSKFENVLKKKGANEIKILVGCENMMSKRLAVIYTIQVMTAVSVYDNNIPYQQSKAAGKAVSAPVRTERVDTLGPFREDWVELVDSHWV